MHAYESRRHPIPHGSARELLRHLIQVNDMAQTDLPEIGPQSAVSAVLSGKRRLNLRMIRALAKRFHLSADAFID